MIKKQYLKSKSLYKVTFSLPKEAAKDAKEVKLVGEFNNWETSNGVAMKATKKDYTAVLELETGREYQFRYLIDQQTWENDWQADNYVATPYGVDNSVVVLPSVEGVPVSKTTTKTVAKKTTTKATTAKKITAKKVTKTATAKTTKTTAKSTVKPAAKKTTTKATTAKKTATKKTVTKADDLKKIEGIGPKIAGLLKDAGICSFNDLAKAKTTVLKKVLADAGPRFKMHNPTTWVQQSKLAAAGKWEELKTLQDKLDGGKRK